MKRREKILSVLAIGSAAPVLLMLIGWWGCIPFSPDNSIVYAAAAFGGFAIGVLLSATVLRPYLTRLFSLPLPALCILMSFYSVLIYGFFMGFPVFCILPLILGGYVVIKGGILRQEDSCATAARAKRMNLFSLLLTGLLCVATAVLTLKEPSILSQLKSMFGLPFFVTYPMVWVVIFAGGALLLALVHGSSRLMQKRMLKC